MHDIVRIEFIEGEAVVSHEQLAEGLGIKAKNVRELLQKHSDDFEQFGVLTFETDKPLEGSTGGRPSKRYYLNEQQATLALTYFRNSDTVRAFKIALVKSFYKMKSQLQGGENGVAEALGMVAKSMELLAKGQDQILEMLKQMPVKKNITYDDGGCMIDTGNRMQLSTLNPAAGDNVEEKEMFFINIEETLKRYPGGLSQSELLSRSDYPMSPHRYRRWLHEGAGVMWNMKIKPGRGYLFFL